MKNKTALLFGIHMHQPVDNFEWVIKHAIEVCYAPFFEVMSRYPEFRFSVHCSGWLMEQVKRLDPKLHGQIKALAHSGSIEFFSAGYYEPILSVIPSSDRVKQIDMLNASIVSEFNQTPEGLWLTERVWESSLIPDLRRSGIKFTVMDDYHFQCAGFDEAILDGHYMTEEGGVTLGVFPISKKLRYAIPFLNVEHAVNAIKSYNRKDDSAAIIFDDAEKFGMWPGTHEWVYKKGWLEKFIKAVLADESIETMHYGQYFNQQHTRGIAYLPNVSYYEMGGWSLSADDALNLESFQQEMGLKRYDDEGVKFLKGGIWKNFFVKYPESNRIHKRMLELSAAREKVNTRDFDTALYKLQTNDPLWHGVFGGLYLPNLRDNAYRYLIEAENSRYSNQSTIVSDQNELDGYEKIKAVIPNTIFRFDAAYGGQLVEFDDRRGCFNWQNTLTRRKEAYHKRMFDGHVPSETSDTEEGIDTIHNAAAQIDPSLRGSVHYDWYVKNSFIDHISDGNFNADTFKSCTFFEYGDFVNQPFEVSYDQEKITFLRNGGLYSPEKENARLEKKYTPNESGFDFEIALSTEAEGDYHYILEHNFHFADYESLTINNLPFEGDMVFEQTAVLDIADGYLKKRIRIRLNRPCTLYMYPLETLSQSEKGFDFSQQGISFAMVIPFSKQLSIQGSLEVADV